MLNGSSSVNKKLIINPPLPKVAPTVNVEPTIDRPTVPPTVLDKIASGEKLNLKELILLQRQSHERQLRIEIIAKVADGVGSTLRRLQGS